MERIKVVHIITKLELGGAQKNTLFTVEHLDRRRFRPYLISGRGGILDQEAERLDEVQSYFLPNLMREINPCRDLLVFLQLRALLRKIILKHGSGRQGSIIVHTHSSKAGILGRFAARWAGVPIILHTFHGFGFHDYQSKGVRNLFISLERMASRVTTRFIAVSENNIRKGIALGIFKHQDVVLIRSGIEIQAFSTSGNKGYQIKKDLGLSPESPVVTMISCFKPQKAPLDFVRMARQAYQEIPEAHFLLVGDGELRSEVERLRDRYGLVSRLSLLGWRHDIPQILRATDILVLTSLWEGLPRVFLEAMATGIPIVATEVDGAPEAIKDGENGFLAPPRDIERMARKVVELIKDPQRRKEMGRKGRSIVQEFDIYTMVRKQEALYEELLKTH